MVLSVSAFPESSPAGGDPKLITRLFGGANRPMDDSSTQQQQPRRPLPSPSSCPTPVRSTISSYKRARTSSQGFGSGSFDLFLFLLVFFMFFFYQKRFINTDDEYSHSYFMGFKTCRSQRSKTNWRRLQIPSSSRCHPFLPPPSSHPINIYSNLSFTFFNHSFFRFHSSYHFLLDSSRHSHHLVSTS